MSAGEGAAAPYEHEIRVRYGECDMQRVVFNANYLAYCDDACEVWMRDRVGEWVDHGVDLMVKKAVVEWAGAATYPSVLHIRVEVGRWGNTSMAVRMTGRVGEQPIFVAELTYVAVVPGTLTTMRIPDSVRALLGPEVPAPSA